MNIDGIPTRSLRAYPEQRAIAIIDQTRLPHALHWLRVATLEEAGHAIRSMQVRGAPLIGATAAYGLALALDFEASDRRLA
ncbi:MAG: S-methyl-5-thioribose-1-phosphate isomerase, partial [Azonexus sp.]